MGMSRKVVVPAILISIALLTGAFVQVYQNMQGRKAEKQMFARVKNTVFYVDSVNGNDNNSGISEKAPWKTLEKINAATFIPGDRILLKSGSCFTGQLFPKGSGSAGNPIVIDIYSSGPKPVINGNGGDSAFYLYNQQYWEIRNIEIVNNGDKPGSRKGIHIVGKNCGTLEHFRLINLVIHDVKGNNEFSAEGKATGGIMFDIPEYDSVKTKFNDVLIEGCTVYNSDRTGIYAFSGWWRASDSFRSGGLVIRNNDIYDIGGDGIIVIGFDKSTIEYNVLHDCNSRSGSYAVGMFPFGCDDTVMQYNEVYNTRTQQDGQAFDVDFNTSRTVVQYNYSHDNEGGFLLICRPGSEKDAYNRDAVIRYNISQNDGRAVLNLGGPVENVNIYNNTIFVSPDTLSNMISITDWDGGTANNVHLSNNIFCDAGSSCQYFYENGTNIAFDHNCYFSQSPGNEPEDKNKLVMDPGLLNPGSGGKGRNTADGYKLKSDSPCIGSGKEIPDNGGKDYWGNPLYKDRPDIGACEFSENDAKR